MPKDWLPGPHYRQTADLDTGLHTASLDDLRLAWSEFEYEGAVIVQDR